MYNNMSKEKNEKLPEWVPATEKRIYSQGQQTEKRIYSQEETIIVDKIVIHIFFQMLAAILVTYNFEFPLIDMLPLLCYVPLNAICLMDETQSNRELMISHLGSLASIVAYCVISGCNYAFYYADYEAMFLTGSCVYLCMCLTYILKNIREFFTCIYIILQGCLFISCQNQIDSGAHMFSPKTSICLKSFCLLVFILLISLTDNDMDSKCLRTFSFTTLSLIFFTFNVYDVETVYLSDIDCFT